MSEYDHSNLACPTCGYNITGLPLHQCPECGKPFDPATLAPPTALDRPLIAAFSYCLLSIAVWVVGILSQVRFDALNILALWVPYVMTLCWVGLLICWRIYARPMRRKGRLWPEKVVLFATWIAGSLFLLLLAALLLAG